MTPELRKAAEYVRKNDNSEYGAEIGGFADDCFTTHAKLLAAHIPLYDQFFSLIDWKEVETAVLDKLSTRPTSSRALQKSLEGIRCLQGLVKEKD